MDNAILTRYLYFLDEAKYSLLHSLLKKTSFDEVLYWVGEIYHSGFGDDLWEILWEYYYRYLSIKFKKYEKILIKEYNLWLKEMLGIEPIIKCFNMIYYLKNIDYEIYFREKEKLKKIYLPKFSWLNLFDKKYHQFILSIHYKNYQNIRWYLQREKYINFEVIKQYFELMLNYKLKPLDLKLHPYKNKKVILLSLIRYLFDNNNNNSKIKIKRIPKEIYENLDLQNKTIREKSEDYKFLGRKRKYYIHDDIGKYPLARNNYKNYKELYWYNWLYYAYRSPIWHWRMEDYDIEIDDKNREIIFKNEDEYEEFTEKYDYEPDEQTQETQDKSLMILSR